MDVIVYTEDHRSPSYLETNQNTIEGFLSNSPDVCLVFSNESPIPYWFTIQIEALWTLAFREVILSTVGIGFINSSIGR